MKLNKFLNQCTQSVHAVVSLATSGGIPNDLDRELEAADKQAADTFEQSKEDAKGAKVYTCPGPRGNGGIFLDPRSESQKQRDQRWQQTSK